MTISQLSIFIENRTGTLLKVLDLMKQSQIQMIACTIAETAEYGISEFYLIGAEAAVKLGRNAEAKTLVNVLRARAGKQTYCVNKRAAQVADNTEAMLAATPDVITIDYILDERSREFWGEGYRWFDLVRTQKWGERATTYHIAGTGYTDKDLETFMRNIPAGYYLRPIPQGQLDGMIMSKEEKDAYQNPAYRN